MFKGGICGKWFGKAVLSQCLSQRVKKRAPCGREFIKGGREILREKAPQAYAPVESLFIRINLQDFSVSSMDTCFSQRDFPHTWKDKRKMEGDKSWDLMLSLLFHRKIGMNIIQASPLFSNIYLLWKRFNISVYNIFDSY